MVRGGHGLGDRYPTWRASCRTRYSDTCRHRNVGPVCQIIFLKELRFYIFMWNLLIFRCWLVISIFEKPVIRELKHFLRLTWLWFKPSPHFSRLSVTDDNAPGFLAWWTRPFWVWTQPYPSMQLPFQPFWTYCPVWTRAYSFRPWCLYEFCFPSFSVFCTRNPFTSQSQLRLSPPV